MKWRLPPLNALRSFEASARLCSFSAAADELGVTPGAISRQIAKLEEFLGSSLFLRNAREVALTPSGREYLEMASSVFATIHRETGRILKDKASDILTIWSSMTVSMCWLVPHLTDFRSFSSEIEVELTTSIRPLEGNAREFDFAIRYGKGTWPGYSVDYLFSPTLVPVCSPDLASTFATGTPKDLVGKTLLHSKVRNDDWRSYCEAADISGVDPTAGPKFESSIIAYRAAVQGMGVAIAQSDLVQTELRAGHLVTPVDLSIPSNGAYYLIYTPETLRRKPAVAFRKWLLTAAMKNSPVV